MYLRRVTIAMSFPLHEQPATNRCFDSGIGGLTVVKALRERLPNETIVYLGDTARVPYGPKSPETVQRYALELANMLMQKNCQGARRCV